MIKEEGMRKRLRGMERTFGESEMQIIRSGLTSGQGGTYGNHCILVPVAEGD